MNNTRELDIMVLIRLLLKNAVWIILAAIVGVACLTLYTKFKIDPTYSSNVDIYVNNSNKEIQIGTGNVSASDLTTAQKLVKTYSVIIQNDAIMNKVGERLITDYDINELEKYLSVSKKSDGSVSVSPSSIRRLLSMSGVGETEVLRINATTTDPEFSANLCNIVAEIAPVEIIRIIGASSVEIIGPATPKYSPVGPSTAKNAAIGGILAAMVVIAIVIIRFLFDNTIKGEEDLKNAFQINAMGEVPLIVTGKGGEKYAQKYNQKYAEKYAEKQ